MWKWELRFCWPVISSRILQAICLPSVTLFLLELWQIYLHFLVTFHRINHSNNAIVKPPELTPQAAAKELEDVMKRVREAQSTIAAAIDPGNPIPLLHPLSLQPPLLFSGVSFYSLIIRNRLFMLFTSHLKTNYKSEGFAAEWIYRLDMWLRSVVTSEVTLV